MTPVERFLSFGTEGSKVRNPSRTFGINFGVVLIETTRPWPCLQSVRYEAFLERVVVSTACVGVHLFLVTSDTIAIVLSN
jgi:hypothetical protein